MTFILIALGGTLGGMARYWLSELAEQRLGDGFPWGTLLVNLGGAFAIGIAAALLLDGARMDAAPGPVWSALVIGALGSYTTVSSFSLQTLALLHAGRTVRAVANVAGSVGGCVAAAAAGLALGGALQGLA